MFRSNDLGVVPRFRDPPGEKELHVNYPTYVDVSLRASAGWSAGSCLLTSATAPFAAVDQSMEVHPTNRIKDGTVRLKGPIGGTTG